MRLLPAVEVPRRSAVEGPHSIASVTTVELDVASDEEAWEAGCGIAAVTEEALLRLKAADMGNSVVLVVLNGTWEKAKTPVGQQQSAVAMTWGHRFDSFTRTADSG